MYSENEKLKKVQVAEKKILQYFDAICNQYGLSYYICGGTLLGAVREGGFIQWDDDADVMMPRKDYEWLKAHKNEILNDKYKLYDYTVDNDAIPRRMPELRDETIKVIYHQGNKERKQYVMLDIFLLDGMPKGKVAIFFHYYKWLFLRMLLQLSWYDETVNQYKANRPLWERCIIWILNKTRFRPSIDQREIMLKEDRLLKKYSLDNSDYVCSLYGPFKKKEILPRSFFKEKIRLSFEDIELWAPKMYHEELTHYYGNYMIPPNNLNERELHHRIEICE